MHILLFICLDICYEMFYLIDILSDICAIDCICLWGLVLLSVTFCVLLLTTLKDTLATQYAP